LRVSDTGPRGGPPPGKRLEHAFWASWNAGDWGSIPELELIWIPPPALGSGKFGTPCERMQSANLIGAEPPLALEELAEDPHALSASAQPTAASATTGKPERLPVAVCVGFRTS
jgi:hypothetical protein